MIDKTYEFVCDLPAEVASKRVQSLLAKEGVEYRESDLSVVSTSTPIAVLGIQRRMYSRSNWVGLNPFVFLTAVNIRFCRRGGGVTNVIVHVNRSRALLIAGFWITLGIMVGIAIPEQPGGAIFAFGVSCAAWLGNFSFLTGYLVKKEIGDCLKASVGAERASCLPR